MEVKILNMVNEALNNSFSYFSSLIFFYEKQNFILFFIFLLFLKYSCFPSPPFPSTPSIPTSHPQTYPLWLCPWVLYTCSLMTLLRVSPITPLSPPLWLLLFCSLFQCLWFYFAGLFVLLIRLHLKVKSYGICLSPPGLFHLAECSPVPSMLSQRVGAPSFPLLHSIPLRKCTQFFDPFIDWWALRLLASSTWLL